MTKFVSTRGGPAKVGFTSLLLSGTAPDGGLFVSEAVVVLTPAQLQKLKGMSYAEMAYHILWPYLGDFSHQRFKEILASTYTAEKFRYVRAGGDPSKIVNLYPLWDRVYLAELVAGPTLAFKDMALQLLAPLVAETLHGEAFTILGGTSGDTGPAAIEAFKAFPNINIFMMSGGLGMSALQKAQMYTVLQANVHNLLLPDFDTTQDLFKAVFRDHDFVAEYNLGAVNSVNLVRILAQVVYAFWSYLQVARHDGEEVDFVVPSGNFGNAFSVYLAKLMGLPVGRIIVATNENDVLHRFFKTGVYERAATVTTTTSPSMDIQVASNLERAIYYTPGISPARVAALYEEFRLHKRFTLTPKELERVRAAGFVSLSCEMRIGLDVITQVYAATSGRVMIDPHTATAIHAARELSSAERPMVIYETAHPLKFADTVAEACGQRPEMIPEFGAMLQAPQQMSMFSLLTPDGLKDYIGERLRLR